MSKSLNHLTICRYVLLLGPIIGTILNTSVSVYPPLVFLSLCLFINAQLRIRLFKNRLFLCSLGLEVLLVLYLHTLAPGYVHLVLFATLIDVALRLKKESYYMVILIAAALLYTVYRSFSMEWVIITLFFFLITCLLLRQLRLELDKRINTEELYDQIRKNNYELESAKARLLNYAKQVKKISQLEERNRISRELHDSIGHDLTGILMQVDATMHIIPLNQEKGLDMLSSVYQNMRNSIDNVSQTVRKLHPITTNHMHALDALIEKFQKDTGIPIAFKTTGMTYPLHPNIEIVLYKNIREALTNAVRHGHVEHIHILLHYNSQHIQLTIDDDGMGCSNVEKGLGLKGMEERLELVGGTIAFSGDKGFHIHMTVPRKEVE